MRSLPPPVRTAGRAARVAVTLARLEHRQWAGALHPGLWRRGFLSSRYYLYPQVRDRSLSYVSDVAVEARLGRINSPQLQALMRDKVVFAHALAERGLGAAAPRTYGVVRNGRLEVEGSAAGAAEVAALPEVVVKPVAGRGGRGVRIVSGSGVASGWRPEEGDLLVQERVRPHPYALAIHPAALNTMRVLAVRLPGEGPVVAAAAHRFGTVATGAVDNASSGGLVSRVDLADGTLSAAVGRPVKRRRVEHRVHPDSGAPIEGVRVPRWPELRQLAVDLMSAFPDAEHVGWDLCLAERGPLVIEGNAGTANLNVLQYHGPFLDDPRVRAFYERHGLLRPVRGGPGG